MEKNRKLLVQIRTKLEFYKKLDRKIQKVLDAELELEDWANETYVKKEALERQLDNLKLEMDLPDSEWDEDEDN